MSSPVLKISDGTTTLDMLAKSDGFMLQEWRPQLVQPKDGGTFAQSAFGDGRQLILSHWDNAIETFSLSLRECSQDDAIAKLRTLRQLLLKATQFWTTKWQSEPVWLAARAPDETNTRYALVYDWRTPEDGNPYAQPFFSKKPGLKEFTLAVERGHWTATRPGVGACAQASSQKQWNIQAGVNVSPAQSTDDASRGYGVYSTGLFTLVLGNSAPSGQGYDVGIRFPGVAVPQGAAIIAAYVRFTANASSGAAYPEVYLNIWGHAADNSSTFSTEANFVNRMKTQNTAAFVPWYGLPAWVVGSTYDTPELKSIIQEIIDRSGWASGNGLSLFFRNDPRTAFTYYRSAAAWDDPLYGAAELHIIYQPTDRQWGRAATCTNEVFIANKENKAQLTNIYHYDNSTTLWSANLTASGLPFDFLPAAPNTSDAVYFGISTAFSSSGPFNSLVFDILTAAANLGTVTWSYYNGAGWMALNATMQDNTALSRSFELTGVNSIHWTQPTDWATANLQTLFGGTAPNITAFWVRAVLGAPSGAATPPRQQNRDIYTIVRGGVEIAATQVPGDLAAMATVALQSQSGGGEEISAYATRVMLGLRSAERYGQSYPNTPFNAYLNLADEQNPTGVVVYTGMYLSDAAFATRSSTPTGRAIKIVTLDPGSTSDTWITRAQVSIQGYYAAQWMGRYRAFLRVYQHNGSDKQFWLRLSYIVGSGSNRVYTPVVKVLADKDWLFLDMGAIELTPGDLLPAPGLQYGEWPGLAQIDIEGYLDYPTGAPELWLYDLILIPTDEWACDAAIDSVSSSEYLNLDKRLLVDSIGNPRVNLRALVQDTANFNMITAVYRPINNGPLILQANQAQTLWCVASRETVGLTYETSLPWTAFSVQVQRQARYLSLRGAA